MLGYIATHGINPALQKLKYDPVTDFAGCRHDCRLSDRAGGEQQRARQKCQRAWSS